MAVTGIHGDVVTVQRRDLPDTEPHIVVALHDPLDHDGFVLTLTLDQARELARALEQAAC